MNKDKLITFPKKKLHHFLIKVKFYLQFIYTKVTKRKIIEVFKKIKTKDWVFCSWRSHYQCLLKGVPPGKY